MENSKLVPGLVCSKESAKKRQAEFESLSRELAEKELELATLENELAVFERRYAENIGVLFAELDEIERQIAEEQLRLHPDEINRRHFHEAEKKARSSRDSVNEKLEKILKQDFHPSEVLKSLYRRVAKTVHPDLSTDEEERAYRTTLMAKANIAFRNGDKEALEQVLIYWEDWLNRKIDRESLKDDLDRLEKKILQIKKRILEIDKKIAGLKKSELFQLMVKVKKAEKQSSDLLKDMADELKQQILGAKMLLANLKQQR